MTPVDTERHERLRAAFVARRGYWNDEWEVILGLDPDYFEAYTDLSSYATEHGSLDPKLRELIYIATCATVTHLFSPGLRQHMRNAFELGATAEELMALFALVSSIGIHTYYVGISALEEVAPGASRQVRSAREKQSQGSIPRADEVIEKHRALYGGVTSDIKVAIEADPAFYDRFLDLAAVSLQRPNLLPPKDAHLILMAVHACATGLWAPGVRQHARAALAWGASPVEIVDVCEQITGMSVHTLSVGVPVLVEELAARRAGNAPVLEKGPKESTVPEGASAGPKGTELTAKERSS